MTERAWWQVAVSRLKIAAEPAGETTSRRADTLDAYVRTAPVPQNAIDIFAGEWASRLPSPLENAIGAIATLFDHPRLAWAVDAMGGAGGKRILELGPLEAGHTYMLDRAGAADILAIESNSRAFLKCLVVKELVGIPSARFVLGDFVEYLRGTPAPVDMVVASGVLYHMMDPAELLARISGIADRVYLWTHYYDKALLASRPSTRHRVVDATPSEYGGYAHALHRFVYGAALDSKGFCGGSRPECRWMTRDGILGALAHFGYSRVQHFYEQPDHPHGPAFAVLAQR